MRFNAGALVVLLVFFAAIGFALSGGANTTHLAEAAVTVLIALGVSGLAFRNRQVRR